MLSEKISGAQVVDQGSIARLVNGSNGFDAIRDPAIRD